MNSLLLYSFIFCAVFFIVFSILYSSWWNIFSKAGQHGWSILIPIYCFIVMLKVAKKPLWWIFLLFVPLLNLVFGFIMIDSIAKKFDKNISFTFGLILLPFIFAPILAFGKSKYKNEDISVEEDND